MDYKAIPSRPGYLAGRDGSIIGKRGHVLRQALGTNGYLIFRFSRPGHVPVTVNSHVAVCEAFHGLKPSPDHEVAHENGVRADNRAENLSWKTRADNRLDTLRHGTDNRGQRHYRAKLTDQDVRDIRASTATHAALGRQYGVSAAHIYNVRTRRARVHVTP